MIKITELKIRKTSKREQFDENGERTWKKVKVKVPRKVKVVSAGSRFGHYIVDLILFQVVYGVITGVVLPLTHLSVTNSAGEFEILRNFDLLSLFFYYLYYALFEFFLQQTPGKMLTKTYVIDIYGNKPTFGKILLRSLIRFVPFESLSCLGELGWHDQWTDTFVVPKKELYALKRLLGEANGESFEEVAFANNEQTP